MLSALEEEYLACYASHSILSQIEAFDKWKQATIMILTTTMAANTLQGDKKKAKVVTVHLVEYSLKSINTLTRSYFAI